MAERLLDDDARVVGQPGLGEPSDGPAEEKRRNLEVEDGRAGALDRGAHPLVRRCVPEVALDVGEPVREALEHLRVDLFAGGLDRRARMVEQVLDRPVVHRHADDRAVEESPFLEPVQRPERHHLRQVTRDPEDHEHVCRALRLLTRCLPPSSRFASPFPFRTSLSPTLPNRSVEAMPREPVGLITQTGRKSAFIHSARCGLPPVGVKSSGQNDEEAGDAGRDHGVLRGSWQARIRAPAGEGDGHDTLRAQGRKEHGPVAGHHQQRRSQGLTC